MKIVFTNEHCFDWILLSAGNSLGSGDITKCLTQTPAPSSAEFAKCWSRILDELVFCRQHTRAPQAFDQLFLSSVKAFHAKHTCSTKTMLCLSILLFKRLCSTQTANDLSSAQMAKHLSLWIDKCIELVKARQLVRLPLAASVNSNTTATNQQRSPFKVLSRHMMTTTTSVDSCKPNFGFADNATFYRKLLSGLTRHQQTTADLLWDLLVQLDNAGHLPPDVDYLFVDVFARTPSTSKHKQLEEPRELNSSSQSEFAYEIANGLLVRVADANTRDTLVKNFSAARSVQTLKALMFDGSLAHDYAHLGFNKNIKCVHVVDRTSASGRSAAHYAPIMDAATHWRVRLERILVEHDIKLVLVRDAADKQRLGELMHERGVIVIDRIAADLFGKLKRELRCHSLVYIEDFESPQRSVFSVDASLHRGTCLSLRLRRAAAVAEAAASRFHSVLVETRLASTASMHKEQLRHCLQRVANVLKSGHYLNGSGLVETFVADELSATRLVEQEKQDDADDDFFFYSQLVGEACANAFRDFARMVQGNTAAAAASVSTSMDDAESKLSAWRAACLINKTLLNTDMTILY